MANDLEGRRAPWMRMAMDWEGVAAALGALLVGMLLGWLWDPLFWIGFAGAVVAVFAARWSHRTAPDEPAAIVAPCDGIIVSVKRAEVPPELRLSDVYATRIRISTGPTATNKLYAPIAGVVQTLIHEVGENNVPFATGPTEHGLTEVYVTLESLGEEVGLRLATGGFGPRLDVTVDVGDSVRTGRVIGTRRLGGWCDVYVPSKVDETVWAGQTIIGGETILGRLSTPSDEDLFEASAVEAALPTVEVEPDTSDDMDDIDDATVSDADAPEEAVKAEDGDEHAETQEALARLKAVAKAAASEDGG